MRDTKARLILPIALVLGSMLLACAAFAQGTSGAIWPAYHYDSNRGGQNPKSFDLTDPGGLNLIWVYPRLEDTNSDVTGESDYIVDDQMVGNGFDVTNRWNVFTADTAYQKDYHTTSVVRPDPKKPDEIPTAPTATWQFPSTKLPAGKYQIYIWVPTNANAPTAATYTVYDDAGSRSFTFDQTQGGGWTLLTNEFFSFTGKSAVPGQPPLQQVTLTALIKDPEVPGTVVSADAVKFVPATGQEIYSSPVSANIPVQLREDPKDPNSRIVYDNIGACVYVGTINTQPGTQTDSEGEGNNRLDRGSMRCIYSVTPTVIDPAVSKDPTMKAIAQYLGRTKWSYPNDDPTARQPIEGPIEGGVRSSPTLAEVKGGKLVCYFTADDRQTYAVDAETGKLIWKGPGLTLPEPSGVTAANGWGEAAKCEDAFGGSFHYKTCDAAGSAVCTWTINPADLAMSAPNGIQGLSYSIYAWLPSAGDMGNLRRAPDATYEIEYTTPTGTTKTKVKVDQSVEDNRGRWVQIGASYFNPATVSLYNTVTPESGQTASDYAVIADAIMIVPDTIGGFNYCSPITNSELTAGVYSAAQRVYAATSTGRLLSFDAEPSGTNIAHVNWIYPGVRTKLSPSGSADMDQPSWGEMGASVAYSGGKLYAATVSGSVYALNKLTDPAPTPLWTFSRIPDGADDVRDEFTSTPCLDADGGKLYIGSSAGYFYCLDMTSGNLDWQYPTLNSSGDPASAPLEPFRYSTPAVAMDSRNVKRVWCAGSGGHVYSFDTSPTASERRLYVDKDGNAHGDAYYNEPSLGRPVQGSLALDAPAPTGKSDPVMYVGDMGDGDGRAYLHWRNADNGGINESWSQYEGWIMPNSVFSSPSITNLDVSGTKVSYVLVGCADGHLMAFTDANGAWGGKWQGGRWPFSEGAPNDASNKTFAAPETSIQFDVFKDDYFNRSMGFPYNPSDPAYDYDTLWPKDNYGGTDTTLMPVIISKEMKVVKDTAATKKTDVDAEMITQAKYRRQQAFMADGRVDDQIYFEWGENINLIIWNLPGLDYLYGSGNESKRSNIRFTMTNASSGDSGGSMLRLVANVRALTEYNLVHEVTDSTSGKKTYPNLNIDGEDQKRSVAFATIEIDGNGHHPPSPGPGWILSVDLKKKLITADNSPIIPINITLAKLSPTAKTATTSSGSISYYEPLIISNKGKSGTTTSTDTTRDASVGINNPLGIRDDVTPKPNTVGWGIIDPGPTTDKLMRTNRGANDVHLNGNATWSDSTGGPAYSRGVTPWINLSLVGHGTSSREGALGVVDRSAVGLKGGSSKIDKFRIASGDLKFRGGEASIECPSPIDPNVKLGVKFPWDLGLGSVDYPDIYKRYQNYHQLSTDKDPSNTNIWCDMLGAEPISTSDKTYKNALLRPDTVLVSVNVPKYQPANVNPGYYKTMVTYIDSNHDGKFDSGTAVNGRPVTWQEAYRMFRVGLGVPPDPKLEVEEQLIDVGRAPHGLGEKMEATLPFSAYNPNPLIQQWFKKLTIKNDGNVNLYNLKLNKVNLFSDQASQASPLLSPQIVSSLDADPTLMGAFSKPPFCNGVVKTGTWSKYLGYTLSKPRVGDPDPTEMTIPDRRKWDTDYTSKSAATATLVGTGWAQTADEAKPLPVEVSVQVPLTQPVGTYQSWDSKYQVPYVAVFSDLNDNGGYISADPVAAPSFQLKVTVRENQLTGGATPTTLPQIDYVPPSNGAPSSAQPQDLPRYGDSTPAAFRDPMNSQVHLFWSSNRLFGSDLQPPTLSDDTQLAQFASAPWFIDYAKLDYQTGAVINGQSTGSWSPVDANHWWGLLPTRIPESQWAFPSDTTNLKTNIMRWRYGNSETDLYSVRHHSPCIGENLAVASDADSDRAWLAWAGTADEQDPVSHKLTQESLIFYTDVTHGMASGGQSTPSIFSIEHDPAQVKRSPFPVADRDHLWMFWQGGGSGNWSIFYSFNDAQGHSNTDPDHPWAPDMKLRTPDCLGAASSPNALLRRWWTNLKGVDADPGDLDAYRDAYIGAKRMFDMVYAGTNKVTRNSDILLTRYVAMPPDGPYPKTQPSRIGQPLPRIYHEKLVRDSKFGFYTSQHMAWVRPDPTAIANGRMKSTIDYWNNYFLGDPLVNPDTPYVHVRFRDGYDIDGTETLPANAEISATDGSTVVRDPNTGAITSVIEAGHPITPEMDQATGVQTYKYPAGTCADKVLGQMLVDFSSGIVRFTKPLKEAKTTGTDNTVVYNVPEVLADYTPMTWRLTTDQAADSSPRAFIEHTSMTSGVNPGLDPNWKNGNSGSGGGGAKAAPVDRLWVFWRKTSNAIDSSTIFYRTMRIGVDLTKLGKPPIPMVTNVDKSGVVGSPSSSADLKIIGQDSSDPRGPWEVDGSGTKIYFTEADERYQSLWTPDNEKALFVGNPSPYFQDGTTGRWQPKPITIKYKDAKGVQQTIDAVDISWIPELSEQSLLGATAATNVNEGSIYAFADPKPQSSGTSGGVLASKIWVFWTSTRGGTSDLFWETLSPNFAVK